MARYTSVFTVSIQAGECHQLLASLLEACNFDLIYDTGDYLMAREVPGEVAFSQLVTVEVLTDRDLHDESLIKMSFVMKNEELPLNPSNHCRQVFDLVNRAIAESKSWRLIESVST